MPNRRSGQGAAEVGSPTTILLGEDGEWSAKFRPDADLLLSGEPVTVGRAVLDLLKGGHEGQLVVVLRHGVLALGERSVGPAHLGRVSVTPADLALGLSPLRLFRMVRNAARRGLDWRPWVDAIHFHRASLWMRWTPRERRQAQRHLASLFRLHFERWPEVHLDLLTDALDQGQVEALAGRVVAVESADDGVVVRVDTARGERRLDVGAVLRSPADPPWDD